MKETFRRIIININWALKSLFSGVVCKKGQILMPSLFLIPAILLFLYLIIETGKLSRGKIRHQFAVDSAAFIEMTNYSNLFNRTAYVNGVFPHRLALASFPKPPSSGGDSGAISDDPSAKPTYIKGRSGYNGAYFYDMLVENTAIPVLYSTTGPTSYTQSTMLKEPTGSSNPSEDAALWVARFEGGANSPHQNTTARKGKLGPGQMTHISKTDGNAQAFDMLRFTEDNTHSKKDHRSSGLYLFWPTLTGFYKSYAQIYMTLGDIQGAQVSVHSRLMNGRSLYRKSYYMNATSCDNAAYACSQSGISAFEKNAKWDSLDYRAAFVKKLFLSGTYIDRSKSSLAMYPLASATIDMTENGQKPGLFQLSTFDPQIYKKLKINRNKTSGIAVVQNWDAGGPDNNFFKIDVNARNACKDTPNIKWPCVKVRAGTNCPAFAVSTYDNNCVWPLTTPRYQARTYPF